RRRLRPGPKEGHPLSDGGRLELQRVAVGIVAQHLDASAGLDVLDVLDALALERGLHRLVVGDLEARVTGERADRRAGAGRHHVRLDNVNLGKDPRSADPVTVTLERRALQNLPPEHAAVEVLRPLGIGRHETFVLHADDVGARDRANGGLRCCWRHDWPPCALLSARGNYTASRIRRAAGGATLWRPWPGESESTSVVRSRIWPPWT